MSDRSKFFIPIGFAFALTIGLIGGYVFHPNVDSQRAQKLEDILTLLDNKYVDTIDKDQVFTSSIQDLLHKLDPHSRYISSVDLKEENESINASFGGIGVRFQIIKDTVCITSIIEKAPADLVGVQGGDKIIAINSKSFVGKKISNEKVMGALKGPAGTHVNVTLLRLNKIIKVKIIRGDIPIETVTSAYMIDKQIGFIKIDQFSVPTAESFHTEANSLLQQGMKKLILDLRGNPGGILEVATKIADEFLKPGLIIVSTKGKTINTIEKATDFGILEDVELVVLIDQGSASASEILAGAIQDNDRGIIVGRRSFGKGLVQQDQILSDGSSVRMTIARYYTPVGRSIQREYDGDYIAYIKDEERYEKGELFNKEAIRLNKKDQFKTKGGKVLYGGGGIMPDVFVSLDTLGNSDFLAALRWNLVISAFTFDYLQYNRNNWKNTQEFIKQELPKNTLNKLISYAQINHKIPSKTQGSLLSNKLILQNIKEEIARQLWQENGYYQMANLYDNDLKKAKELFQKK